MAPLPRELRKSLDDTVVKARAAAESAARAALSTLAVDLDKAFGQLSEGDRELRRALRAKGRQLGSYDALVSEIAYQHWHRMLFARFLAENQLLIHPEAGIDVSLAEVADLAREEGESDPWVLAARYAAQMLPAIFREADPELALRFAAEGRKRLEDLLASLPASVFTSDDALGWVYQFWQSENKKEVNKAGNKIGAAELPAVTQLFTEDYMVRFLLENSLGAWWAGHHPGSPLLEAFTYLRFTEEGAPAAGTFEGWPDRVAEVTVMDPSCGSGHFLTAAFEMLTAMRAEEEGMSAQEAGDAVIGQNLFGLEIDPRCTQIAAFALALAAWRAGGYRELPSPNIACSGIGVAGQLSEWKKLAGGDLDLQNAVEALHEQFRNAPELGSLIDPRRATEGGHLFNVEYDKVAPLLEELLAREADPETQVAGWAAAGIARAASLLARTYTLVATNVPFLGIGKQSAILRAHISVNYSTGRWDLAMAFARRIEGLLSPSATSALVAPGEWLYVPSFEGFRQWFLTSTTWRLFARLGWGAFSTPLRVQPLLGVWESARPTPKSSFGWIDVGALPSSEDKSLALSGASVELVQQLSQLENPRARIEARAQEAAPRLSELAEVRTGLSAGDGNRFERCFWEVPELGQAWEFLQTSVSETQVYGGRSRVVLWEKERGAMARLAESVKHLNHAAQSWRRGKDLWGRPGVAMSLMGDLPATLYGGDRYDANCCALVPKTRTNVLALWSFASSGQLSRRVRDVDHSLAVRPSTLLKVSFDLEHWTRIAEELYPDGLPEPYSNDPTQWLFKGDPTDAIDPLQVAVARLLGYRWPDQESDPVNELADADGVVSIPAFAGERPAAERLRVLLERAWGSDWSVGKLDELLTLAGAPGKDLDTWLRESFFALHAKLFHNRPFIWHIWDGRKDGFGVLVNYHRLDRQLLDRITHTLVGSWIETQRHQVQRELPGAEARLGAAEELQRKLELIAEGEPPYDMYVRWKPLHEQPIGWDPDLNDGVRLNVRPFVEAGVLRSKFTINWNKDRGKDPDGSERLNDLHITRAEKEAAREKADRSS